MLSQETRILKLPQLNGDYALVSLPRTAWYWLDDFVRTEYSSGGYKALVKDFARQAEGAEELSASLKAKAQELCDRQMSALYNLANDNTPPLRPARLHRNPAHPQTPDISARMPSAYRLFHFMPHATYLTTVWERRNYHLRDLPA